MHRNDTKALNGQENTSFADLTVEVYVKRNQTEFMESSPLPSIYQVLFWWIITLILRKRSANVNPLTMNGGLICEG